MGIALPTPLNILARLMVFPRSKAFGVMAFGSDQNGISLAVYTIPHKT